MDQSASGGDRECLTEKRKPAPLVAQRSRQRGRVTGGAAIPIRSLTRSLHLQDLVRLTGEDQRTVRKMIHEERRLGVPILSDNISGYFLPSSQQEREACVQSLRHRAKEILAAAAAIEKAVKQ